MMMHNYLGDNLFDEDWADTPLMREYFGKGNFLYGKHAKSSAAYRCKRNRRCD